MIFLGERPGGHELAGIASAVIGMLALVLGSDARRNVAPAAAIDDRARFARSHS